MDRFVGYPEWYESEVARMKTAVIGFFCPSPTIQSNLLAFTDARPWTSRHTRGWIGRYVTLSHRHRHAYGVDAERSPRMDELDALIAAEPEAPEHRRQLDAASITEAIEARWAESPDQCASVSLQGARCRRPPERGVLCGIHFAKLFSHEWEWRPLDGFECSLCGRFSTQKEYKELCHKKGQPTPEYSPILRPIVEGGAL